MAKKATRLKKAQIAHLMRAVAAITGHASFVLVGTGAVIARSKTLALELMRTREIDIYAVGTPDAELLSDLIDGSIGEGSPFDETFGYYAHGVSEGTAYLPGDWMSRAASPDLAAGVVCLCPDANDIGVSKLCAWREKDRAWIAAGLNTGLLDLAVLRARSIGISHPDAPPQAELRTRLDQLVSAGDPPLRR